MTARGLYPIVQVDDLANTECTSPRSRDLSVLPPLSTLKKVPREAIHGVLMVRLCPGRNFFCGERAASPPSPGIDHNYTLRSRQIAGFQLSTWTDAAHCNCRRKTERSAQHQASYAPCTSIRNGSAHSQRSASSVVVCDAERLSNYKYRVVWRIRNSS